MSLMCCWTQALHSELIGRRLDVNQMCLSLAVKVPSDIETAAGQILCLSVLRHPRGTFILWRFLFHGTGILSYVS